MQEDDPRYGVRRCALGWEMVDEGWGRRAVDLATLPHLHRCARKFRCSAGSTKAPGRASWTWPAVPGSLEMAGLFGAERAGMDALLRLVEIAPAAPTPSSARGAWPPPVPRTG